MQVVAAQTTRPATAPVTRPLEMPHYGAWHSSRIGGGGYVQNVVPAPSDPNRVYCYLDVGGPYRSDDGGWTWQNLQGNLPGRRGAYSVRSLLVDPRDWRQIIVAVGSQWEAPEGVYISDNGGESFRRTLQASFQNDEFRNTGVVLARQPGRPDVVLAGAIEGGVYRSLDGGRTWEHVGFKGINPTDIRFDASQPARAWLCASRLTGMVTGQELQVQGGFFMTEDAGKTWRMLDDNSPLEIVQDMNEPWRVYGIFDRQIIQVSQDRGVTWAEFSEGLPIEKGSRGAVSESRFNALAAGPGFVLTASARGTIYRLDAGQKVWKRVERESVQEGDWFGKMTPGEFQHFGAELGSIVIDPRDPNHWFITDWYAIYQTHDAGRNWTLSIHGIEATTIHQLLQDPVDGAVVHLAMADNGYFRSIDGASTFQQVRFPGGCSNVKDLALSPRLPARVYAVGSDNWEWKSNQLYVSSDAGQTWVRAAMTGLPDMRDRRCNSVATDPDNPMVVYLAVSGRLSPTGGGPYRSTDGGRTWEWFGDGLPLGTGFYRHDIWGTGREIAAGPKGVLMTISQDTGQVYRRGPGDEKWQKVEMNAKGRPFSIVADVQSPGRFFIGHGEGGVYRTKDAGLVWQCVYDREATHVCTDMAIAGRAAASTADGVILSRDGGDTWAMLDKSIPDRVKRNMGAFAGERLVVGSGGSGVFWMPLSPEGEKMPRAKPSAPATQPVFR